MGFERCPVSPCLYRYVDDDRYMKATIHVDDGLMMADSKDTVDQFITQIRTYLSFDLKLYNPVQKFLGMHIEEDDNYVYVHQKE